MCVCRFNRVILATYPESTGDFSDRVSSAPAASASRPRRTTLVFSPSKNTHQLSRICIYIYTAYANLRFCLRVRELPQIYLHRSVSILTHNIKQIRGQAKGEQERGFTHLRVHPERETERTFRGALHLFLVCSSFFLF